MHTNEMRESEIARLRARGTSNGIKALLIVFIVLNIILCSLVFFLIARPHGGNVIAEDIQARHFTLVDEADRVCVEFKIDKGGSPHISLFENISGKSRLQIELDPNGDPFINFFDRKDKNTMKLGISSSDTPGIRFYDENLARRMTINLKQDGSPIVTLHGPDNRDRLQLSETGISEQKR